MTPVVKPDGEVLAVTEADVAAAEADAAKAEEAAADLERAIVDGDETITADQLAAQKSLGVFARLRAASVARKHEKAKEDARQAACRALADEITSYGGSCGDELAGLLAKAHEANEAFRAAVKAHNNRIHEFHRQAAALGVPTGTSAPRPPAEHGRLAISAHDGMVHADMLRLGIVSVKSNETADLVDRIASEPGNAPGLIESCRTSIATQAPGPDAGLVFYRGTGGATIGYDKPFTEAEAKVRGLKRVPDKEVWA